MLGIYILLSCKILLSSNVDSVHNHESMRIENILNNNFFSKIIVHPPQEVSKIKHVLKNIIYNNNFKKNDIIIFLDIDLTLIKKACILNYLPINEVDFYLKKFILEKVIKNLNNPDNMCSFIDMIILHEIPFLEYIRKQINKFSLIESDVPQLLKELKKYNVIIIGLTARNKIFAQKTYKTLYKLGIDFSELSTLKNLEFKIDENTELRNGIIYTANIKKKAQVIVEFMSELNKNLSENKIWDIIHIDDNPGEIISFLGSELLYKYDINLNLNITPFYYYNELHEQCNACIEGKTVNQELQKTYDEFLQHYQTK